MPITLIGETKEVVEGGGNFSCGNCGAEFHSPRQLLFHDEECPYGSCVEESKREVIKDD